jgi:hypothetical protein
MTLPLLIGAEIIVALLTSVLGGFGGSILSCGLGNWVRGGSRRSAGVICEIIHWRIRLVNLEVVL